MIPAISWGSAPGFSLIPAFSCTSASHGISHGWVWCFWWPDGRSTTWSMMNYPPEKTLIYFWKQPYFCYGKIRCKWPFSIAMIVCQRLFVLPLGVFGKGTTVKLARVLRMQEQVSSWERLGFQVGSWGYIVMPQLAWWMKWVLNTAPFETMVCLISLTLGVHPGWKMGSQVNGISAVDSESMG